VTKPVRPGYRRRGVGLRVALVVAAVVAFVAAGSARAEDPVLFGDVGAGDAFTITLTDASGSRVAHLDPGRYTVTLRDHSDFHNFHLSGPGVDVSTAVDFVGTKSFTVTFSDGTYFFNCDPHSSQMKGTFTVGAVSTPPPPVTSPPAKVAASVGPGAKVALSPVRGLSSGKAVVTVRDRSAGDGFRLSGPGVSKATGVKFRGTVRWTVTLEPGKYVWGSVRSAKLRRSFTVSG